MRNLRTIILAAGKGTRMKSDTPKVLHEVCGRPMIQYVLDVVKSVGSLKTYVVLGHKSDSVKKHLPKGFIGVEQPQLLGTADAVRCAGKYLKNYRGDVLILCADTPLLEKKIVKDVLKRHKRTKAACTFLTAVVCDPRGYGRVLRDPGGRVVAVREDRDAVGCERDIAEINVGVYCFQGRELFRALKQVKLNAKKKEFYLTDIIELFYGQDLKIETVETEDASNGLGINTQQDLSAAAGILRQRILNDFMLQGITIADPKTTHIDASVKIGKDTRIRPFSFIEKGVRIGNRCVIGPFARLRPGVKIGNDVEIGNFTEVSRSTIGDRTLVKHFSYLGDSSVGSDVNIGAGAVTANFDGKQKNMTKIEDGAFIGSDSVLIAPVRIGKKAVVGAGSVVTKGKTVPVGGIAVGVPAKISLRRDRR